jgi:hypothetical protein
MIALLLLAILLTLLGAWWLVPALAGVLLALTLYGACCLVLAAPFVLLGRLLGIGRKQRDYERRFVAFLNGQGPEPPEGFPR